MSDISPIGPPATSSAAASQSIDQVGSNSLDADMFLQLLIAQLKYQDPTSPAEGTEFLAQTAQFTMVEKLSALAETAEAGAIVDRNLAAASMVGRTVTWLNPDGTMGEGTVERARLGSDGPVLEVAGADIAFDFVTSVVHVPAPTTTTTTTTTTATTSPATEPTSG